MSGHSKWSKVKHQKATTDVIKAKAFTKAARAVTIAVQEGGGITDPQGNFKLRLAIEQARAVNMPKENIERAIAKAKNLSGEVTESLLYEGYGPEGIALIIEAASENRQRTVSAVKNVLEKNGGVLAAQGAVMFQFNKVGCIIIERTPTVNEETMFADAVESDADDVVFYDDSIEVYTSLAAFSKVKDALEEKKYIVNSAEISYRPLNAVEVSDELMMKVDKITDLLHELDDVQKVHTNIV